MLPPKAPSENSFDEINSTLDAKLENMLAFIAKNQSNMEASFIKALEEQRKEFTLAQKVTVVPPKPGFNNSPSSLLAGIIICVQKNLD